MFGRSLRSHILFHKNGIQRESVQFKIRLRPHLHIGQIFMGSGPDTSGSGVSEGKSSDSGDNEVIDGAIEALGRGTVGASGKSSDKEISGGVFSRGGNGPRRM